MKTGAESQGWAENAAPLQLMRSRSVGSDTIVGASHPGKQVGDSAGMLPGCRARIEGIHSGAAFSEDRLEEMKLGEWRKIHDYIKANPDRWPGEPDPLW